MTDQAIKERSVHLTPTIGLVDVVMLGAGSALGFSIFSILSPAAQIAGSGLLLTIMLAMLPMVVYGLIYATLASIDPCSGASFEWPRTYLHPFAGFIVAWLRIFGSVGQITTIGLVLVHYLGFAIQLPETPSLLGILVVVFLFNLGGLKVAAGLQTALMALLIVSFAIFSVAGLPHVETSRILPLAPHGPWPILVAAPIMVSLFMGIESATEVGEEVVWARRNVPLGIGLALLLIALLYGVIAFTTLGLIGPDRLGRAEAPLLDAARISLGRSAMPVIVGTATLALLKSLNASFLIFARLFFAMARASMMPTIFAGRPGTHSLPRSAACAAFVCCCFGLLMPRGLIFLFLASNIPLILKYGSTSLCLLRVATHRRSSLAMSVLGFGHNAYLVISSLGVVLAICLFALGYASDWRPYAAVGAWAFVGTLFWFSWLAAAKHNPARGRA